MRSPLRILAAGLVALLLLASPSLAWSYRLETARTADGLTLRLLRLANPGRTPVLLAHGIGSNAMEFDLPGRSMAAFLADRGYDVWCLNFRGAGATVPGLRSDGRGDHDFDDLVVLDMPAAVEAVRRATGRRPFLAGHSQGGMVAVAWLSGARRVPAVVQRIGPFLRVAPRIVADPAEALARARRVRGVVAIGSPARFTWPTTLPWRYWDHNLLLTYLAWSPSANAAARVTPLVPAARVMQLITDDLTRFPFVGPAMQDVIDRGAAVAGRTFLLAQLLAPRSVAGDVLSDGLDLAVDDVSVGVLRQFMDGIRTGDMREAHTLDPARRPHSYVDGTRLVRAPVLWIAGSKDKLANEEAILAVVRRMTVADRTALVTDHGHCDLVIGDTAPADVWRPVVDWLDAR